MKNVPHVVLTARLLTSLRLQKTLAYRLIARGWHVTFLFWDEDQHDAVARARQEIDGLAPLVCIDEFPDDGEVKLDIRKSHLSPLRCAAAKVFCKWSLNPDIATYRVLHERMIARSLAALAQLAPSAIVVNDDGVTSNFRFLAAARQLGIPIIGVPFAFSCKFIFDLEMEQKKHAGDLHVATGANKWALGAIAPQWLKTGQFADAVMFPPAFIMSLEASGVSIPDAWTLMGGFAETLCVESEAMKRHYVKEGVPLSKMVMTGSPYTDEIVESLAHDDQARAAFRQPRWIDPDRPRILIAWWPDRHAERGRFSEFQSYREMTLAFFRRLHALDGVTVTVSMSPNCPDEARSLIESEGFAISDENIMGLIARNDLLVIAYSSTRRWAFASGKPVIGYDAYDMEHHELDAPGFITTRRLDDVVKHLDHLTKSPDAFRKIAARQCEVAEHWGIFDGQCSSRIAQLIEQRAAEAERAVPA